MHCIEFVRVQRAEETGRRIVELATGYDAMITAPLATAAFFSVAGVRS